MLTATFQPSLNVTSTASGSAAVVRFSLSAGADAAFDAGRDRVEVDVRSGSVWLTEDQADHLLKGGTRHACGDGRRVVITALTAAVVEVRRQRRS